MNLKQISTAAASATVALCVFVCFDFSHAAAKKKSACPTEFDPAKSLEKIARKLTRKRLDDKGKKNAAAILQAVQAGLTIKVDGMIHYARFSSFGAWTEGKITQINESRREGVVVEFFDTKEEQLATFEFSKIKEIRLVPAEEAYVKVVQLPDPEKVGDAEAPLADNQDPNIPRMLSAGLINGYRIEDLEARMRPRQLATKGFLGKDESLRTVMADDNTLVTKELGLSHHAIANALFTAMKAFHRDRPIQIVINDQKLSVTGTMWRGFQYSPFYDETKTFIDFQVVNLNTRKQIKFSGLLPEMIRRYGFYEGKGTPYRTDPKDIAEVFGLIAPK